MLFNSFAYLFAFLPGTAIVHALLRRHVGRQAAGLWLLVASLAFYAWGNVSNLPVLAASVAFNFLVGRLLGDGTQSDPMAEDPARRARRRWTMIAGVTANVAFLAYYKYFSHLPLGISFFTLTQVMYLVDVYEGLAAPNSWSEHAVFAAFFPTVTMGPLLRVRPFMEQFRAPALRVSALDVARAVALFSMGLAKKIVIADSFGRLADAGFDAPASLSMLEAWCSSVAYSLQLYYDFSGYSDMAVASAALLGLTIPANFNSPYQSKTIIEFWQRWHISLSGFITTYLYTPIVRSFKRVTFAKAMFATFTAMLIAGLWHGSTWNYVVFGALHGAALVTAQAWKRRKRKLPPAAAWLLTMLFVNFAFVFFRSPTIPAALEMVAAMGRWTAVAGMETWKLHLRASEIREIALPLLAGALVFGRNSTTIAKEFRPDWKSLAWVVALTTLSLLFLNSNTAKEFLYVDF